jgi:hypothetical protein
MVVLDNQEIVTLKLTRDECFTIHHLIDYFQCYTKDQSYSPLAYKKPDGIHWKVKQLNKKITKVGYYCKRCKINYCYCKCPLASKGGIKRIDVKTRRSYR